MPSDADAFVVGSGPNGASGRRDARRRGLKVLVIEGAATSGGAAERRVHAPRHLARRWLGSPLVSGGLAAPPAVQPGREGRVRAGGGVRAPVGWGGAAAVTRAVTRGARGPACAYPEVEFVHPLDGGQPPRSPARLTGTARGAHPRSACSHWWRAGLRSRTCCYPRSSAAGPLLSRAAALARGTGCGRARSVPLPGGGRPGSRGRRRARDDAVIVPAADCATGRCSRLRGRGMRDPYPGAARAGSQTRAGIHARHIRSRRAAGGRHRAARLMMQAEAEGDTEDMNRERAETHPAAASRGRAAPCHDTALGRHFGDVNPKMRQCVLPA